MKTIVEIRQPNYTMEVEMAGLLKGMPSSALSALLLRMDQLEAANQNLADQVSALETEIDGIALTQLPIGTVVELNFIPANINELMGYGSWAEDTARAGRVGIGRGMVTDARGASASFASGSTGGEIAHVQTIAEIAQHEHQARVRTVKDVQVFGGAVTSFEVPAISDVLAFSTAPTGTGEPMNVMQPYIVRTYWVRTS